MLPFPGSLVLRALGGTLPALVESGARTVGAREIMDFGPVFLPERDGPSLPVIRKPEILPTDGRGQRLAVCSFALSILADDRRQDLFSELSVCAGHTLFLDFKLPERNLEWPAFLLASPLRRIASRGRLESEGGMEGVLYKEKAHFTVLDRYSLKGGALCAVLVRNQLSA